MSFTTQQPRLLDILPGQQAEIASFSSQLGGLACKRLQEIGLLPGTAITLLRKAPGRGPVQIKIRQAGTSFSLREELAGCLNVTLSA
jgi:ferrous iron transport protein A